MRRLVPILALVAAACTASTPAPAPGSDSIPAGTAPDGTTGRIDTVLDGDSLRVVLDGVSTEVRLLGINAPERGECWADQARTALDGLATARSLTVVDHGIDQYGRVLAYLYDGPTNLNLSLVAAGHALVVASEHDLLPEFIAAEDDAVRLERGLWGPSACGDPIEHAVGIWGIEYDAPGRDDLNPNGEFVLISNEGDDQDLTGWMVRDESSVHRYIFPEGFVLERDAIVTIRSGCGVDEFPDFYWCADTSVWTNSGDTVLLLEPTGAIADRVRYFGVRR